MPDSLLRRLLIAISGMTVVSGALQALGPARLLRLLSADRDATHRHLFATIGMFMVVAGGGLLHALLRPVRDPVVVLWAAVQKIGAFVAVAVGVRRRIFSPLALGVAFFDLVSGALAAEWWRRIR